MADDKEKKEYDVEGSARAEGKEGDTHDVEFKGEASVSSIKGAPVSAEVTETYKDGSRVTRPIDVDDARSMATATAGASRETAKVAAGAAQPSAFTRRGSVD